MKIVSVEQMRLLDELTQSQYDITSFQLMEAAGRAIAQVLDQQYHPEAICIVCGKGNNAGDGFVVARALYEMGRRVLLVNMERSEAFKGAALTAWEQVARTKIEMFMASDLDAALQQCEVVVDALLGTGLKGDVREPYAMAIQVLNQSSLPILSIDVPSGLRELKVGEKLGTIVSASITATVGLPKTMMLTYPGASYVGDIKILPINFPPDLLDSDDWQLNQATTQDLADWLPCRMPDSNKGSYGHVGIIGGAVTYAGATMLTARAALRSGCGLATIYALPQTNSIYKIALPEATSVILESEAETHFDQVSATSFALNKKHNTVLAVGPGMGTAPETKVFLEQLIKSWDGPLVLDADALNLLADGLLDLVKNKPDCMLTPHPGELARLTGSSTTEIQADREGIARNFAMSHKVIVLLKGACTLVARPDGQVWMIPGAEPALAKGGTGDVLTGVIASLFAQGIPMWQAAVLGATAHLQAGGRCSIRQGTRGVLASNIADEIPRVLDTISDGSL